MPRSWIARALSTLLPNALRCDLFEPAALDLEADRLRNSRGAIGPAMLVIFLDCWRLAPADVLSMFLNDLRHAPSASVSTAVAVKAGSRSSRRNADYMDLQARQQAFESIAAYDTFRTVVYGPDEPFDAAGLSATPEILASLRMQPSAGRSFTTADVAPNTPAVVMLGYEFWQKRFGGDPGIIGRSIKIGVTPAMRQVVGIAPPGFRFPASATTDVIFSKPIPTAPPAIRKNGWYSAAARLKSGVTLESANTQLAALARQMEMEHPSENLGSEYHAVPVRDAHRAAVRRHDHAADDRGVQPVFRTRPPPRQHRRTAGLAGTRVDRRCRASRTLDFAVPADRYREVGARETLHKRLFESIGALPGIEHVGVAAVTPLTGNNWTVPFDRADKPTPAGQRPPEVGWQSATGGYFRALNIPLRDGRYFCPEDGPAAPPVVIISEAVAERFFKGERAVVHKVLLGPEPAEIVGIVGNIRRAALTDSPRADMYFPMEHAPSGATTLFVRTASEPVNIVASLRTTLRSVEIGNQCAIDPDHG
ncbi:hypothetical protein BH18ACI5_BH18ACI5_29630 [soil metagenome]